MARGRPLEPLRISPSERERLLSWTRRHRSAQASALRALIVLGAAAGETNRAIRAIRAIRAASVGRAADGV